MDAWVKDVLQPLLIAILATAIGSGSVFVLCVFLCKFMMKWWQSRAGEAALRGRTSDADSGHQSLPQADAAHDVEMRPFNGEAVIC
ncbi:hypothetical protein M758_7G028900 [Ceratodon purpureus]|nr:hypothetical protein M758_7G028900 [Ceratodon purpureus]